MDNFTDLMNKTASIYSRTWVPDGYGGGSYTNTLIASIKGVFWQRSASGISGIGQIISDRISNTSTWIFACEPNANFDADNIVIIDGVTYQVAKPDDILFEGDIMIIGLDVKE